MPEYNEKYNWFEGAGSGYWFVMEPLLPAIEFADNGYKFSLDVLNKSKEDYITLVKSMNGIFSNEENVIFSFNKREQASKFCSFMNKEYKAKRLRDFKLNKETNK